MNDSNFKLYLLVLNQKILNNNPMHFFEIPTRTSALKKYYKKTNFKKFERIKNEKYFFPVRYSIKYNSPLKKIECGDRIIIIVSDKVQYLCTYKTSMVMKYDIDNPYNIKEDYLLLILGNVSPLHHHSINASSFIKYNHKRNGLVTVSENFKEKYLEYIYYIRSL